MNTLVQDPKVVCPLCPLHCDDVLVSQNGIKPPTDCRIADEFLPGQDRGELKMPSQQHASETTQTLSVITTGVDLATSRALLDMQNAGKVDVQVECDPSIDAHLEMVARDGIVSATLADVAQHADRLWMIGKVEKTWPRLMDRVFGHQHEKRIQWTDQVTADELTHIEWGNAKYTAVIIGPAAFAKGQEAITATILGRMIRRRNEASRAVLLTLDSATTLASVSLWKTNRGVASTQRHLTPHERFDVRLGTPLDASSIPASLQIGGTDPGPTLASAYRASAVAGLNQRSMTIRGDGSVSLPLGGQMESQAATAIEILGELLS